MAITNSAFDTTTCSGFAITKIKDALQEARLMGGLKRVDIKFDELSDPVPLWLVTGGNPSADSVPFFKHPFFMSSFDTPAFVLDVRDFGKWSAPHQAFQVRNGIEFAWNLKRAVLNTYLLEHRIETLRDLSVLPLKAYAALVSQSVARRFALAPAEQMIVSALAGYFYLCQFTDISDFQDHEKTLIIGKLSKALGIPVDLVSRSVKDLPCIHSLEDLCQEVNRVVSNVALENFNLGTLIQIVSGNWYGTNSRETLAVALEHMPTWLLIVEASLSSATFRRSTLAKIVQKLDTKDAGVAFTRSLNLILGGNEALTDDDGKVVQEYSLHF